MAGLKNSACVLALTLAVLCTAHGKELPKTFPLCKQNNPKMDDCLLKAINKVIPELVKGVPSLGVNSIDPLEIAGIAIDQGSGPVSMNLSFWNMKIYGFKKAKITNLKANVKKYELEGDIIIPGNMEVHSMYKSKGRVLFLPLAGNGKCKLTLVNLTAKLKYIGEEMKKGGQSYMKIKKLIINFDTDKLVLYFENLFGGNGQLGGVSNTFLNENWREILNEVKPTFQEAFGHAFKEVATRIFDKVPYNKIFPER